MKPDDVRFGGHTVEPYKETVEVSDPRVLDLAARSVALVMQEVEDAALANRVAEYNALLGYFEESASRNGGAVPIDAIRDILAAALRAEI